MSAPVATIHTSRKPKGRTQTEPAVVRWLLIAIALVFLALFLLLPLAAVFSQAFEKGLAVYWAAITEPVQTFFQCPQSINIYIVGRLIKQQYVPFFLQGQS